MFLIIKTEEDVSKVSPGDVYMVDTYPAPELENQEITQEMLDLADKLEDAIQARLTSFEKQEFPMFTKAELNKMRESEVVELALERGIPASVDDKKSDTVEKVLAWQEKQQ